MTVKDFLHVKYNIDINDFNNQLTNEVRNQFIFNGLDCSSVFEKELSDLNNKEIIALFWKLCIKPNNRAMFDSEVIEYGKEEMKEYLNL